MKTGYACDVCHRTTLRGIIHRIGDSIVCHNCRNIIVDSYGEDVDVIGIERKEPCSVCLGDGFTHDSRDVYECVACDGTGKRN